MTASLRDPTSSGIEGLLGALAAFGRRALREADPHALMNAATEIVCAHVAVEFCSVWELLAAKLLGIARSTLRTKLETLSVEGERT